MRTFPVGSMRREATIELGPAPGLNDSSSDPSALSRATRLRLMPATVVNEPAIIIFPSGCSATRCGLVLIEGVVNV